MRTDSCRNAPRPEKSAATTHGDVKSCLFVSDRLSRSPRLVLQFFHHVTAERLLLESSAKSGQIPPGDTIQYLLVPLHNGLRLITLC
jgi:hypothetical protein